MKLNTHKDKGNGYLQGENKQPIVDKVVSIIDPSKIDDKHLPKLHKIYIHPKGKKNNKTNRDLFLFLQPWQLDNDLK